MQQVYTTDSFVLLIPFIIHLKIANFVPVSLITILSCLVETSKFYLLGETLVTPQNIPNIYNPSINF